MPYRDKSEASKGVGVPFQQVLSSLKSEDSARRTESAPPNHFNQKKNSNRLAQSGALPPIAGTASISLSFASKRSSQIPKDRQHRRTTTMVSFERH